MERPFAWKKYNEAEVEAVMAFAADYREFLSQCKTERECVSFFKAQAIKAGFKDCGMLSTRALRCIPAIAFLPKNAFRFGGFGDYG